MKFSITRPGRRARLAVSLAMASAVGLLSVTAASAQPLKPVDPDLPAIPPTLSATPHPPMPPTSTAVRVGEGAPRAPHPCGLRPSGAASAFRTPDPRPPSGAARPLARPPAITPITAVFMAPVGVLAVIGTPQDDTITVSRDAA